MISIVIPTLNPDKRLAGAMSALVPAAVIGLIKEVIVVDGGSVTSHAADLAEQGGAHYIQSSKGRGSQLSAGADNARGEWLLFLHADTILENGWEKEAARFIERVDNGELRESAGVFKFSLDDFGYMPRILEFIVNVRCFVLALPYGDQGLLLSKSLYNELGGFKMLPLMEDVDIVRRLGRKRLVMFQSRAITSAKRYQKEGYIKRMMRNMSCLALYYLRVPPRYIDRIYG